MEGIVPKFNLCFQHLLPSCVFAHVFACNSLYFQHIYWILNLVEVDGCIYHYVDWLRIAVWLDLVVVVLDLYKEIPGEVELN